MHVKSEVCEMQEIASRLQSYHTVETMEEKKIGRKRKQTNNPVISLGKF